MMFKFLSAPTENIGRWSRFLWFQGRVWRHCIRLLGENRSGTQAAALSYHTLFGIVPLTIVMLMVFQMFPAYKGVGDKVRGFFYTQLHLNEISHPADDTEAGSTGGDTILLTQKLDELTEKYITRVNTGAITLIGAVLVIWAAIGLLTTIERAFNTVWRVGTGRRFINRMVTYWGLLTLGPLLLGIGFYASTQYLFISSLQQGLYPYIKPVIPFAISMVLFFFLYYVIPNTHVDPAAAAWGAFVASLLWLVARFGFTLYMKTIPYQSVYGMLGIIPLSVFWIYVSWLVVLFGLQLTYATQHVKTLDTDELSRMHKRQDYFIADDISVIGVMAVVADAFDKKEQPPMTAEQVSCTLDMPLELVEKLLEQMVKAGVLCRTSTPIEGFVPSTGTENITLADIAQAIRKVSFAQEDKFGGAKLADINHCMQETLSGYTLKDIIRDKSPDNPATQQNS